MGGTGFDANPDDLRSAASKILDAVGDTVSDALGNMPSGGDVYGHDGLHGAVSEFCATVQKAVQIMQGDVEGAGAALGKAAGSYASSDEGALGLIQTQQGVLGGGNG